MAFLLPTYRIEEGERIDGSSTIAIIHNGDSYCFTNLSVYKDGDIDCWGLIGFEEFKEQVRSGRVVTQIPDKAEASLSMVGHFRVYGTDFYVEPEELIKEVADEIERLNDRPTTLKRCRAAFETYTVDPSVENLERLRLAYEAVPKHRRVFLLGDMDTKDWPIRQALYGDDITLHPDYPERKKRMDRSLRENKRRRFRLRLQKLQRLFKRS